MSPDAWIIEELEREERPSAVLELEIPQERAPVPEEARPQRRVYVLDISPDAPNEIKI